MDNAFENLFSVGFTGISWLALVPALLLGPLAVFYAFRSTALIEDRRYRKWLLAFRAAALLGLLLLLLQPVLTVRRAEKKKSPFYLLLDASPSMIKEGTGGRRASDFLAGKKQALAKLADKYDFKVFSFSADSLMDSAGGLPVTRLTPFREVTSLSDALEVLREKKPAGMLLLSDGLFSDRLFSRFSVNQPLFDADDEFSGCRFYPVRLAREAGHNNIVVTAVEADEFAYVKNPFTVRVKIRAEVPSAIRVPVRVTLGGEVAASAEISLKKGVGEYEASMEITPEKVGYFIYAVTVPHYSFENSEADNRREFALKVIRDRIRVMHICGRPSWDERFLRETLKKDPAVDLVAFYILRTASDVVDVNQDELSLIEFPYRDLFEKDLSTFDLVIFQNFSFRMFFPPEYIENIRKFTGAGGAFWMIGGDLAFSEGGYRNTAVEEMLPYSLVDPERSGAAGEYTVKLTPEGASHPVTSESKGLDGFKFEGLNLLGGLKENSLTLACTQNNRPFLGVREYQKGRSAALATDNLWFYNFASVGSGQGNRSCQELVRRMVRWLVKDPAVGSVGLSGLRNEYPEGASISFSAGNEGGPAGASLEVSLINGRGKKVASRQVKLQKEKSAPVDLKNPGRGLYIVRAEIFKGRMSQDYTEEAFEVNSAGEYGDAESGEKLLNRLAAETGGSVIAYDEKDLAGKIQVPEKTVKRIVGKRTFPLWNTLAAVILVCLAFGVEWFLRKRKGLL